MITSFPVTHSLLNTAALLDFLNQHYSHLGNFQQCEFIRLGQNDTYLTKTQQQSFILRIYRHQARQLTAIASELELLNYLNTQGFSVSIPLADNQNQTIQTLQAPEGIRYCVLFSFIIGKALILDEQSAFSYGQKIAQLHQLSDNFPYAVAREIHDIDYLLLKPLQAIQQAFQHKPQQLIQLNHWVENAIPLLTALPSSAPYYGICHGDHFGNSLVNLQTGQTFFDFDCCGNGWRLYDIAQFFWAIKVKLTLWSEQYVASDDILWQKFLAGYQSLRPLHQLEWAALPAMMLARAVWVLGLQPQHKGHWGTFLYEPIFQVSWNFMEKIGPRLL